MNIFIAPPLLCRVIFKVNWETLTIEIVDTLTKLKGLDKNGLFYTYYPIISIYAC